MPDLLSSVPPYQYAIRPFDPALVACAGFATNKAQQAAATTAAMTLGISASW
jgi:hypothetical protein